MPEIFTDWKLDLDAAAVLRGQGADPDILRSRKPRLFEIAVQALDQARPLIHPQVLSQRYPVESILHSRIRLPGGHELKGEGLAQHLASAHEVQVVICTIGSGLEEHANRVMETDMIYGLALYGAGSAAVEALANAACQRFEAQAAERGWRTTIPLSPGMIGWSVADGQPQIFSLLDAGQIGVQLTASAIMLPMKSLSLVLGLGPELSQAGSTCDVCALVDVCKYQHP